MAKPPFSRSTKGTQWRSMPHLCLVPLITSVLMPRHHAPPSCPATPSCVVNLESYHCLIIVPVPFSLPLYRKMSPCCYPPLVGNMTLLLRGMCTMLCRAILNHFQPEFYLLRRERVRVHRSPLGVCYNTCAPRNVADIYNAIAWQ